MNRLDMKFHDWNIQDIFEDAEGFQQELESYCRAKLTWSDSMEEVAEIVADVSFRLGQLQTDAGWWYTHGYFWNKTQERHVKLSLDFDKLKQKVISWAAEQLELKYKPR